MTRIPTNDDTALAPSPPDHNVQARATWVVRAATAAPDRAVMALFWLCLVVAAALLTGTFRAFVVLPAAVVVWVATWRVMPERVRTTRATAWGAAAAVVGAIAWVGVNAPFASRYVLVTRDPGFLTLQGLWLASHASPNIRVTSAAQVAATVPGVQAGSGSYRLVGDVLEVQGAKLLPGILAIAHWFGGMTGLFVGNLVIGALALLAFYALARRVVGPLWGLLPVAALAVSLPMVDFSRAAYTEPLAMALVLSGLTLCWSAVHTHRRWQFALAGGMVGATALVRIDGAASVIGLVAGLALVTAFTVDPKRRRAALLDGAAATGCALAGVLLGYLDLRLHSALYLHDLGDQFTLLIVALAAVVIVGAAASAVPWQRPRRWLARHARVAAAAATTLVAAVAIVLVTRRFWSEAHSDVSGAASLIATLQTKEGLPVDPTRSYGELAIWWISWYFGPVVLALGLVGLAAFTHRAARKRDAALLLLLSVLAAPSLLYLWQPGISPDQIWAMRRLLPVTIPAFLLAATHCLTLVARRLAGHLPRVRRIGVAIVSVASAAVFVFPLTTWGHLFRVVEDGGRNGESAAACAAIGDEPVVYVQGKGPFYMESLVSMCGVPVVWTSTAPSPATLAAVRKAWGGTQVKVLTFDSTSVTWDGTPTPVRTTTVTNWELSLTKRPQVGTAGHSNLYVGTVNGSGTVTPLAP